MEHHQHRRRAESPAPLVADAHRRAGHLCAGAAVETAHLGDVVVHQEAQDQVPFSQQVAPFLLRPLRMGADGVLQQPFQSHHLGDLPPGEHPAHEHQNGQRMFFQHRFRTTLQKRQHRLRLQRSQKDPSIRLDDLEGGVIVAARLIGVQGVQILLVGLVPIAVTAAVSVLLGRFQLSKRLLRTSLHHVVEPEGHAVGQTGHKGVLLGQSG